jgi:probable F420-dependent oxidoreductase
VHEDVKLYLILSESWTMTDPRDLRRFVQYAVDAEEAGFDGVMVGEHVVMGPNSAFRGKPENPRDWIMAGNQESSFPHPSNLVLLSAMAAVTSRIRLIAGALLTPLRHPLALAKDLATLDLVSEGRLVVIPGVSWQEEEYAALNVPFHARGAILDEQLEIWQRLWTDGSPVAYSGKNFQFGDAYVEPQPYRPGGPEIWIGGKTVSPWAIRRAVRHGRGFFTIVPPTQADLDGLSAAMSAAGREMSELELAAFVFGPPFKDATSLLDIDEALETVPSLLQRGVSHLVFKPSQFIDDGNDLGAFCRSVKAKVEALSR